jgi:hypothetical protein
MRIPAGTKIRLFIENHDDTPEEFDSPSLNREKMIPAHAMSIVYIGPLQPGIYPYVGEFHEITAKGAILVK